MKRTQAMITGAALAAAMASSANAGTVFSAYHESWENFNYNTGVMNTRVSGTPRNIGTDVADKGVMTVTLAFATGTCGSEDWNGNSGSQVASANVPLLVSENVKYIVSTGGAGASFLCPSSSGLMGFIDRWNSSNLLAIDFDIENGQTASQINALMTDVQLVHAQMPALKFSFTIATEGVSNGSTTAVSGLGKGKGASDPYNGLDATGNAVIAAVRGVLGWDGTAAHWPSYVTIDLMTMDFGDPPQKSFCVVASKLCEMGQSTVQAVYNQASAWSMPYSAIEVVDMIGGNDNKDEHFTLADVDTVVKFARSAGLGGVHYWAWDRDRPCAKGAAKDNCNTMGASVGVYAYVNRYLADGLK